MYSHQFEEYAAYPSYVRRPTKSCSDKLIAIRENMQNEKAGEGGKGGGAKVEWNAWREY